jgi:hypothetical protein
LLHEKTRLIAQEKIEARGNKKEIKINLEEAGIIIAQMNIYREIKITAQEKRGPVKTRCKDKENIVCSPRQKK